MKCPKCGYLGFETSDRCRNCGYDFSLAIEAVPPPELPLQASPSLESPLADLVIADRNGTLDDTAGALDLNRLIGTDSADDTGATSSGPGASSARLAREAPGAGAPSAPSAPSAPGHAPARKAGLPALPFGDRDDAEAPMIAQPRPARAPLSVRRTTPEIPRTRSRLVTPRPDEAELALPSENAGGDGSVTVASTPAAHAAAATASRRLLATLIDIALLGSINAAVLYLTLALSGLTFNDLGVLPLMPIAAFFAILDGGYLIAFVAASGQTIGKMIAGIRVTRDDGERVDFAVAALRAVGCGISLLTAGLGYLPAFLTADRRALQDRISGTRVVSAR
jgi:uncharacterized RDD family membrane protein YckC